MSTNPPTPRSRRDFLTCIGLAGSALSLPLTSQAAKPLQRKSNTPLKLSLAAYSMRNLLPNYRSNPKAGEGAKLQMDGFIQYCADLGIDGAEITSYFLPHPCPGSLAADLKKQAHLLGISISGGAIGNNFTYPKGLKRDAQMKYTTEWIKSYSLMGAPVIRVFAGNPAGGGLSPEQAEANIIETLTAACKIAGEHGVLLAMENHDFTTDINRFIRIVEAIDSPWFGANLDTGNIAASPDPYKDIARMAPYAVNAQLKVKIPVNGKKEDADFKRLIDILREANYRGYVVLEYEDREDPYKAVPRYLDQLRKCIEA